LVGPRVTRTRVPRKCEMASHDGRERHVEESANKNEREKEKRGSDETSDKAKKTRGSQNIEKRRSKGLKWQRSWLEGTKLLRGRGLGNERARARDRDDERPDDISRTTERRTMV